MLSDFDKRCQKMEAEHNAEVKAMWRRMAIGGAFMLLAAVVVVPVLFAALLWVWKQIMG
jgi:hypothetical protein